VSHNSQNHNLIPITTRSTPRVTIFRPWYELVRQHRSHIGITGLVMTGDTSPERLIEAQKVECRLLHKPVNPDDLKRALIACF
jgi:hypothetical protein